MTYIISALVFIIIILLVILIRKNTTIKALNTINELSINSIADLQNQNSNLETGFNNLKKTIENIELKYRKYFILLATSNIKVYTKSNFYSTYTFYNGRFYAKVNNKDKNNKAEGIPVIEIPDNKNAILNLYDLSYTLKKHPNMDIEDVIKECTTLKETLIEELNNKILKSYKR